MKKLLAVLAVVLATLAFSFGCSNGVTDPGDPKEDPVLTPTPGGHQPRPTPNPCGPKSNPLDC